jgi:hypothetical protein
MPNLKLFMILLGCTPKGRHVEQHDFFFGIGPSLLELIPEMNAFWPEAEGKIHIDAWREVNVVEGYRVKVVAKGNGGIENQPKLFFINLGGYQENKFEEQHYVLLTVKPDRSQALREAKQTLFYQHNFFEDAVSHVDDKYGIDVDDLYQIEDILTPTQKQQFQIDLEQADNLPEDKLELGYLKISSIK